MVDIDEGIVAFDPSGTGQTGYFYFVNWENYEFGTITGENSVEHGESINSLIKTKQPKYVAWESSNILKMKYANADYMETVYLAGIIPFICCINNISSDNCWTVNNLEVYSKVKDRKIGGLEQKLIQGKLGRPKNTFFFQNKAITEHEADALAVFFILWTRILKRLWIGKKINEIVNEPKLKRYNSLIRKSKRNLLNNKKV